MDILRLIFKTVFLGSKTYFMYVIFGVFLSLFIYILSSNVIYSIEDYMKGESRQILLGDITMEIRGQEVGLDSAKFDQYRDFFEIAKSKKIDYTLYDENRNPRLVTLNYISDLFPFYHDFEVEKINDDGDILVPVGFLDNYPNSIQIYDDEILVSGIITNNILSGFGGFSDNIDLYLPLDMWPNELDAGNARITNTYYFKLKDAAYSRQIDVLKNDINFGDYRFSTPESSDGNIDAITDRLSLFITFFNLIVFVLSFFVVALSLEGFFKKTKKLIGTLNIFGMTKIKIFLSIFLIIFLVFFFAFLISLILSSLAIIVLSNYYDFFGVYFSSFIRGYFVSIVLLFVGIGLPFYKIYKANPIELTNDNSNFSSFKKKDYFIYLGLIFISFLSINIISRVGIKDAFIFSIFFVLFIFVVYFLTTKILSYLFRILSNKLKNNFYNFDAIRSTIKPGNVSFLIIFSGLISFLSIFVFFVFSGSFLGFLKGLTTYSNDTFIINATNEDESKLREYFNEENIFEIVSLRIREVNGIGISSYSDENSGRGNFTREYFSTTNNLDNEILRGNNLSEGGVSVDGDFASRLGVDIGDNITFGVAGLEKRLEVVNIREPERSGTDPFFFFQLYRNDFKNFPKTYIVSYNSNEFDENLSFKLSNEIGNHLTFINTKEIVEVVIDIASQVIRVVYVLLFYIFLLSLIVFTTSLSFLNNFKKDKIKLLNTLGGELFSLKKALKNEYLYLIVLSATISIILGIIILILSFSFIDYFGIDIVYLIYGVIILICLLLIFYTILELRQKFKN